MPQPNPNRPSTCILADDLTGACDAASAFAARAVPTEVRLQPTFDAGSSDVLAFSSATRDVPSTEAVAAIESFARIPGLDQIPHLFKKMDSVFRGNTFIEIATSARVFSSRFAVIAPASPRHGRTCTDGLLHVRDLTGRRIMSLRPTLNAASEEDLAAIVQAARALAHPILWIGSSGFAHALAASLHPAAPHPAPNPPPGKLLLFSGSSHPVTAHQLAHLRDHGKAPGKAVKLIQIDRNRTPDDAIRAAIRTISPATTGALVMNGGDTALKVCRALHISSIHLFGEFAPGIPLGLASGGPFNGCTVILKSGGFGDVDLFARIAHLCSAKQGQPA